MDKLIPHKLNEKYKRKRFEISSALLLRNQNYPFLYQIAICDKKWIMCNDRKRSAQWLVAEKAPQCFPKHPKYSHQRKVMVTVWWSSASSIPHRFIKTSKNQYRGELF